jgi:PAS domain S-box-containing protein
MRRPYGSLLFGQPVGRDSIPGPRPAERGTPGFVPGRLCDILRAAGASPQGSTRKAAAVMDDSGRNQLAHNLHGRRDAVAEAWFAAIARTSFAPLSPAQVRKRLSEAVAQAIELLLAEQFEPESARQIGADLARLHYTQPEVLGRTIRVLSAELVKGLPADQVCALLPKLATLLEAVSLGFAQRCTAIHVSEQEAIRGALVAELRAAEGRLREAHDSLAEQVELRTAELRASQEQLHEVLENIDAVVVSVDPDGRFTFVSPPVTNVFGLRAEEVIGHPFHELVYADDLPRLAQVFAHPFPDRRDDVEFRFVSDSGKVRWAHVSTHLVFDGKRFVAAHGIITDVTDRRHAEEALRESEERWRSLVAHAPDLVFTLDREGRIVFVNRFPAGSLFGPRDVLGRAPYELALEEDREAARTAVEQVLATGTRASYEAAVPQPNGVMAWLRSMWAPCGTTVRSLGPR